MKKIILKITVAGAMIFLLANCSKKTAAQNSSQNPPPNQQGRQARGERPVFADLLSQMDGNKDGKLSKTEVQGPLKNDFSKMDKDKDGFISEAEFKDAPPPRQGRN